MYVSKGNAQRNPYTSAQGNMYYADCNGVCYNETCKQFTQGLSRKGPAIVNKTRMVYVTLM